MQLRELSLLNYKNIEQAELIFSPKINCFVGSNGMGKTNVLDAIYFLSFCKSHTGVPDSQIIRHDTDFAILQGCYGIDEKTEEFYCGIKRGHKKTFKHNKKEYERLSDHIGMLPLVMVSPSDFVLITGGSEERRRFIDMIISQYDREYLFALIAYNKALTQRNTLLKSDPYSGDDTLLEIWELQMEQYGSEIFRKRQDMIGRLSPVFDAYYGSVSGSYEKPVLEYESQLTQGALSDMLKASRQRDRILGFSSVGVHKDDLKMELDHYPVKRIASQGQNKTFLVALKLAQYSFLKTHNGHYPILLLDDVFDKLDAFRVEKIIQLVSGEDFGQIFISDTNRNHINEILLAFNGEYKLFDVKNGDVTLNEN
ncbi:MAG: DNA replication/repair protein RecF [Bacteroidales bacterium]|nr:DNA replication/repair protein RecF [Bacteroidales bacterium]